MSKQITNSKDASSIVFDNVDGSSVNQNSLADSVPSSASV